MSIEQGGCGHLRLRFGSGGYYIFCNDCAAAWIAWKMGSDERVQGVIDGQPINGSGTSGARLSEEVDEP